jgi:hypothetical protein
VLTAQQRDSHCQEVLCRVREGLELDYSLSEDGLLYQGRDLESAKLVVPEVSSPEAVSEQVSEQARGTAAPSSPTADEGPSQAASQNRSLGRYNLRPLPGRRTE